MKKLLIQILILILQWSGCYEAPVKYNQQSRRNDQKKLTKTAEAKFQFNEEQLLYIIFWINWAFPIFIYINVKVIRLLIVYLKNRTLTKPIGPYSPNPDIPRTSQSTELNVRNIIIPTENNHSEIVSYTPPTEPQEILTNPNLNTQQIQEGDSFSRIS